MKITSLTGNSQRLDGGAMFGNVPKALWTRWVTPDAENRIPLACRAFLVEDGPKKILLETGIGAFFSPKMRDRFGVVEPHHVLLDSLAAHGLAHTDIDLVVLSHLHFDHAGGLLTPYEEGVTPQLLFPNARYLVGTEAWHRALQPHTRDRASFIPELQGLLKASGRLELVEGDQAHGLHFHRSEGHTPGLLLAEIPTDAGPAVFAGDLIPATPWVHLPITMGYDRFPERLIDEKSSLLEDLVSRKGFLLYTHDPAVAMSGLSHVKGRYTAVDPRSSLQGWPQ